MQFTSPSKFLSTLALAIAVAIAIICICGAQVHAIPTTLAVGGDEAYGLCQTDCNNNTVACYKANNATFGTVVAVHGEVMPGILACNKAQGACHAACAAKHLSKDTNQSKDTSPSKETSSSKDPSPSKNPSPPATRRRL